MPHHLCGHPGLRGFSLAPLQFPLNGLSDQIQPGLPGLKGRIHSGNGLSGYRKSQTI